MEVYLVIVLKAHVFRIKALVLEGIGRHDTGGNGLLYFNVKLFYGADALFFLSVLSAPDGQRSAPVAAAGKVPVLDVLQPLAEAARTCAGGLPGDGFVECHHLILHGRSLDEPAVKRIVQHGKVCAPAMRIAVDVLLHLECAAIGLHHYAEVDVQGAFFLNVLEVLLVSGLDVPSGVFLVGRVYGGGEGGIHVFQAHEAALTVYLGLGIAILVHGHDCADSGSCRNAFVVCAEGGGDMHYASTVTCGDIVSGNYAESVSGGLEPRNELMIADTYKVLALETAVQYLVRHNFVAFLVGFHRDFGTLRIEPGAKEVLGKHIHCRSARVGVEGQYADVLDLRTHAKCGIGRKGPGRGGPGQEVCGNGFRAVNGLRNAVLDYLELHGGGGVAYILVAAGLVELMGAEAGAVCGRIRLDGVALVQEALVINLLEEVPQGLDVAVVVGDVRVLHVYPVTYALCHVFPFGGIFHHLLAAGGVVFVYAHLGADIGLSDAKLFLHAKLYGKAVGIPACPAGYAVTRLRLIAADGILDGARHHVVNAGHSVCRRRAFKEHKLRSALAKLQRLPEGIHLFPSLQDIFSRLGKVQPLIFFECHIFFSNFALLFKGTKIIN